MPPPKKKKKSNKKAVATTLIAVLTATFASVSLTSADKVKTCNGVERWDVKTLQDPAADSVDYDHIISKTVTELSDIDPGFNPNKKAEFFRHDIEKIVYVIRDCKIDTVRNESHADGDYHLVIKQGNWKMIGEIPDYHCKNNQNSPAIEVFKKVRDDFTPLLVGKRYRQHRFDITGVGFFDPPHNQTGRSKNGIELHPILEIKIH